jgi:hypothetical protein
VDFPRIYLVRQDFPDRSLKDIPAEVQKQLEQAAFASKLKPGARIAIGAGSRGISDIAIILKSVVNYWKKHGCKPFIFPAMGSHGGATAEGQAAVLAHFGIDEASMGCPLISSLDVVSTGRTPEGIETFMDRNAYESDGAMLVGRVKWHTDFSGNIESGLCKMTAIGIGKLAGARQYHVFGQRLGLEQVIRSVLRQVAKSGKILGGLAILEDATHTTAQLAAVSTEDLEQREEELLALVKSWSARIPMNSLDVLIVDKIGKNISGTGMDTKVINRSTHAHYNCFPNAPFVHRIFARDLDDLSCGNAVGLGMADIVSDRLLNKIDWDASYLNSLTACTPAGIRTPIHFPTDRECLEKIALTVGKFDPKEVTIGWLTNTLELRLLGLSENLAAEIRHNPKLEIVSPAQELRYDSEGNLPYLKELAERFAGRQS